MPEICDCCGKPICDNKAEWGGLWLNLQRSIVSHHYHKECAEKVHEAIEACCKQGKKEGRKMDKIIPIEANSPHDVFECMCWRCGKRWIAVMPTGTDLKDLECPECHKQGYAFLTGQELTEEE